MAVASQQPAPIPELLGRVEDYFDLALRQWRAFSNDSTEDRDIDTDKDLEADTYRAAVKCHRELFGVVALSTPLGTPGKGEK